MVGEGPGKGVLPVLSLLINSAEDMDILQGTPWFRDSELIEYVHSYLPEWTKRSSLESGSFRPEKTKRTLKLASKKWWDEIYFPREQRKHPLASIWEVTLKFEQDGSFSQ